MSLKFRIGALVIAVLVGTSFVANAAKKPDEGTGRPVKLIKPYSELKDLTSDQIEKIKTIHGEYLKTMHEAEIKQHDEILAVLTENQKTELGKLLVEEKKGAAKSHATTEPSK